MARVGPQRQKKISNYTNEHNMATEVSKDLLRICSQSKIYDSHHEIHIKNTHFQLLT